MKDYLGKTMLNRNGVVERKLEVLKVFNKRSSVLNEHWI